jgi:hypothetical protein
MDRVVLGGLGKPLGEAKVQVPMRGPQQSLSPSRAGEWVGAHGLQIWRLAVNMHSISS